MEKFSLAYLRNFFSILQKEMSTNFSNTITFDRQPACLFLSKAYLIVFKSFFIHMSTQAFVSLLRVLDQPKNEAKNRGQQTRSFFLDSYFSCCLRQCEHRFACRYNNNVFSAPATPLLHLVSYILSRSTKQVKEAPKELVLEDPCFCYSVGGTNINHQRDTLFCGQTMKPFLFSICRKVL